MLGLIGSILNYFSEYAFFYLHQINLLAIIAISLFSVKNFLSQFSILNSNFSLKLKPLGRTFNKYYKKIDEPFIGYFILFIMIVFKLGVFKLEYVTFKNITSMYGLGLMMLSIVTSITGYSYYLLFLALLRELSQIDLELSGYTSCIPTNTEWFEKLINMAKDLNNAFVILGLMFTFQYAALIPTGSISFKNNSILNTPNNKIFALSWLVIFFFIVIGFPLITYKQNIYFKKIITNIKNKQILELDKMIYCTMNTINIKKPLDDTIKGKIDYIEYCMKLIKEIKDQDIISRSKGLFFACLPSVLTFLIHISTLFINITDLITKLIDN